MAFESTGALPGTELSGDGQTPLASLLRENAALLRKIAERGAGESDSGGEGMAGPFPPGAGQGPEEETQGVADETGGCRRRGREGPQPQAHAGSVRA